MNYSFNSKLFGEKGLMTIIGSLAKILIPVRRKPVGQNHDQARQPRAWSSPN